ncbi:MAG: 50S ribosomal protein L30 [Clostridiales bacterium]|jgi:large subunit ribosomal protein L30|nr:50S ribosomal protein L30 [Clostridiales bacterium]MBO4579871.1 50S ribosomal protein L30 [Clostridiales bacterium]MBO4580084.1 50S ribosomal protein L30 [Clostridiales bacterium]
MANLKITLVKSTNKARAKEKATVRALGLKKIGQSVEKADNEAMRGMATTVRNYVTVEEV